MSTRNILRWTTTLGFLTGTLVACGDSGSGDDTAATMTMSETGISTLTDSNGDGDGDGDADTSDSIGTSGDDDPCPPGGCLDLGGGSEEGGGGIGTGKLDILFVIDNSGTMAEEQINLAQNLPGWSTSSTTSRTPRELGAGRYPDHGDHHRYGPFAVHGFYPDGYTPAKGAPVASPCLDRLSDFQNSTTNAVGACLSVCEQSVTLNDGNDFIRWNGEETNVNALDLNNNQLSGVAAVTAALECFGPQGISGCGYESPLEAMTQALNPNKPWNSGETPFLRDDALLAIAIVTDEADCSTRPDGRSPLTRCSTPGPSIRTMIKKYICDLLVARHCGRRTVFTHCTMMDNGVALGRRPLRLSKQRTAMDHPRHLVSPGDRAQHRGTEPIAGGADPVSRLAVTDILSWK